MKIFFICSKKSVRTLKFTIEPYFLSHAERGKSWRGLGLAGIQPNHRRFAPTHFFAGILISFSCGGQRSRTSKGLLPIVFKTIAIPLGEPSIHLTLLLFGPFFKLKLFTFFVLYYLHMKILGIDYGTKRIGVAISDENNRLAFPKEIVPSDINTFKTLGEVIEREKVSEIVVGESVDFSGKLNALSARIDVFILELKEKFKLPIHKQKEFLTSVEARRSKDGKTDLSPSQAHNRVKTVKRGRVDAQAAAFILQRYFDKKNLKSNSENSGDII